MADNRTFAKGAQIGGAPVYYKEEPTSETSMPNTSCFKTVDVDGNPVKIPRDNMMSIVLECLGTILNGGSDQGTVTKVPTLNGNTFGASSLSTLASLLGGQLKRELNVFMKMTANGTPQTHTIPGKPICLLFGIEVSTSDNLTAENTPKTDLIVPTSNALNWYWCAISGNTITFNFPGYAGNNYGAVKFDVLYI